jgi:hypothetical protein
LHPTYARRQRTRAHASRRTRAWTASPPALECAPAHLGPRGRGWSASLPGPDSEGLQWRSVAAAPISTRPSIGHRRRLVRGLRDVPAISRAHKRSQRTWGTSRSQRTGVGRSVLMIAGTVFRAPERFGTWSSTRSSSARSLIDLEQQCHGRCDLNATSSSAACAESRSSSHTGGC